MNQLSGNPLSESHLTDEHLLEWLEGLACPAVEAHLASCVPCRAEAFALQEGISRYAIALRRQAAQAQSAHLAEEFTPARVLARHRLRWAGAVVLALLLAAQTAWMLKPHHEVRVSKNAAPSVAPASVHPSVTAPASPQSATAGNDEQLSDDELLQAVNNDLSREVPQALAPVGAITVARNRIAESFDTSIASPDSAGKVKQGEDR